MLRLLAVTCCRTMWAGYCLLTSVYCLLAFLPYTYVSLIKSPPYEWVAWFVHHQALCFWLAFVALSLSYWKDAGRLKRYEKVVLAALALSGLLVSIDPFLASLQNNSSAYAWSLVALLPLFLSAIPMLLASRPEQNAARSVAHYPYCTAVFTAIFIAAVYAMAGSLWHPASIALSSARPEILGWSALAHVLIALIAVSALNLIISVSVHTRRPATFFTVSVAALVFACLAFTILKFLHSAFSFEGWQADVYAICLAASIVIFVSALVFSFTVPPPATRTVGMKIVAAALAAGFSCFALFLPKLIAGSDWNGLLEHSFALLCWTALFVCGYVVFARRAHYGLATVLAVVFLAALALKTLDATKIFWARPLGSTDDEVARSLQNYAAHDASFELVQNVLSNRAEERCGDLCRILREYTNIRDAHVSRDLVLADDLTQRAQFRPNIFFFVIDSLRPDYLGAYNPRVDFTPNLDAFARDSIVLHNVYTQYMGTSLSEPAIWAGAELLHAHYMQPFAKVNSLEKLAKAEGYRMVVSNDEILSQLLTPSNNLVRLDTDKKIWNQIEICSTVRQTEQLFTGDALGDAPVLFYTQPKNVHQFANNDLPHMTKTNWQARAGFNDRIAYELHQVDGCFGEFVRFLKARGIYDKSIIIVTSDHGDATGEFGRYSHSLSIFPEVMHVPLIVHLPAKLRGQVVYDDRQLSTLTDITPSLYYLLGHHPIEANPFVGHAIFVKSKEELRDLRGNELFLASDERAVYGLLTQNGRFLYTTYDSPAQSFLFDLSSDPNALHNILTPELKKQYDDRIIEHLQALGEFYGYKPGVGSLFAQR